MSKDSFLDIPSNSLVGKDAKRGGGQKIRRKNHDPKREKEMSTTKSKKVNSGHISNNSNRRKTVVNSNKNLYFGGPPLYRLPRPRNRLGPRGGGGRFLRGRGRGGRVASGNWQPHRPQGVSRAILFGQKRNRNNIDNDDDER